MPWQPLVNNKSTFKVVGLISYTKNMKNDILMIAMLPHFLLKHYKLILFKFCIYLKNSYIYIVLIHLNKRSSKTT